MQKPTRGMCCGWVFMLFSNENGTGYEVIYLVWLTGTAKARVDVAVEFENRICLQDQPLHLTKNIRLRTSSFVRYCLRI